MRFQKGQSIVEFALILPLFLLFLFGIVYFSMVFLDYMTLSTVARNSAREAAVANAEEYADHYQVIRNRYTNQELLVDLYDWKNDFKIDYQEPQKNEEHGNVIVTINAKFKDDTSWLPEILDGLTDSRDSSKLDLHITCTMYSEDNWKTQK